MSKSVLALTVEATQLPAPNRGWHVWLLVLFAATISSPVVRTQT